VQLDSRPRIDGKHAVLLVPIHGEVANPVENDVVVDRDRGPDRHCGRTLTGKRVRASSLRDGRVNPPFCAWEDRGIHDAQACLAEPV